MGSNQLFWVVALAGMLLDQGSKLIVLQSMALYQSIALWQGVFHLTFVTNTGAAFSLLQQSPIALKWISLLVSMALIALGALATELERAEKIGYGFILAGAVGNGIDRFAYGYVIDFLDFRLIRFPVFNLADVWINLGILCLLWVFRQQIFPGQKP